MDDLELKYLQKCRRDLFRSATKLKARGQCHDTWLSLVERRQQHASDTIGAKEMNAIKALVWGEEDEDRKDVSE